MDEYNSFFKIKLKNLPTEILRSIQSQSLKELQKRRQADCMLSKEFNDVISSSRKFLRTHSVLDNRNNDIPIWNNILNNILDENWSHLFSGDLTKKYYVYVHFTPAPYTTKNAIRFEHSTCDLNIDGIPFYIGKGSGDRAFDLKRNQGHGKILKEIQSRYSDPLEFIKIIKDNITEPEALELESKLIYFFGTKYESNRKGLLVNLDIPKRPH